MLEKNNRDKGAFQIKMNCLILMNREEEEDLDKEEIGEILMEESNLARG